MKDSTKLISVIVPCYNEEESLPLFYAEIQKVSAQMQEAHPELTFEYLFIDDGSKDRTLKILRSYAREDKRVRFISFSRNFGKEAGIYAGLSNAKGDYCVVMDADLQHPPAFLPKMYEAVKSGKYDCATTRRVSREGESKVRSWFARLFYKIINKISQTEIVDGAQDFRFMTRQMVDAVLSMSEYNRFSKGIFSWVGFRVKYIEYENVERVAGTSAWSFWGLFRYSLEGIIGFSTAPLTFSVFLGLFSCLIGLIMMIATIVKKLCVGEAVLGYPTLICSIVFFGGLQMFCTGILGMYLSKTYLEVKHRPIYVMRENEENMDEFPEPEEPEQKALPEDRETMKRIAAFRDSLPEQDAQEEPLDEMAGMDLSKRRPRPELAVPSEAQQRDALAELERLPGADISADLGEPFDEEPYDEEAYDDFDEEAYDGEAYDEEPYDGEEYDEAPRGGDAYDAEPYDVEGYGGEGYEAPYEEDYEPYYEEDYGEPYSEAPRAKAEGNPVTRFFRNITERISNLLYVYEEDQADAGTEPQKTVTPKPAAQKPAAQKPAAPKSVTPKPAAQKRPAPAPEKREEYRGAHFHSDEDGGEL